MSLGDVGFLLFGVVIGWVTKIPLFLKLYREWEEERLAIRKWMEVQDKEAGR